jgi:hypothetical protein
VGGVQRDGHEPHRRGCAVRCEGPVARKRVGAVESRQSIVVFVICSIDFPSCRSKVYCCNYTITRITIRSWVVGVKDRVNGVKGSFTSTSRIIRITIVFVGNGSVHFGYSPAASHYSNARSERNISRACCYQVAELLLETINTGQDGKARTVWGFLLCSGVRVKPSNREKPVDPRINPIFTTYLSRSLSPTELW